MFQIQRPIKIFSCQLRKGLGCLILYLNKAENFERMAKANEIKEIKKVIEETTHRMGSCLNIISGRAEIVLRHPDDIALVKKNVEIILKEIHRATLLIKNIVDE